MASDRLHSRDPVIATDEAESPDAPSATLTCPECDGALTPDGTETVCAECGLVADEDSLDRRRQYIETDDGRIQPQSGPTSTELLHDKGLSTNIGHKVDHMGNALDAKTKRRFRRLRKHQSSAMFETESERMLAHGLSEVRRMATALGLGESYCNQACVLFRSAQSEGLLQGRTIEGFATAAIYAVCRVNNVPRTRQEFERVSRIDGQRIWHSYDLLNREMNLPTPPTPIASYIPRVASETNCMDAHTAAAKELAEEVDSTPAVSGLTPATVAAACVWSTAPSKRQRPSQAALGEAADCTPPSVRLARDRLIEAGFIDDSLKRNA